MPSGNMATSWLQLSPTALKGAVPWSYQTWRPPGFSALTVHLPRNKVAAAGGLLGEDGTEGSLLAFKKDGRASFQQRPCQRGRAAVIGPERRKRLRGGAGRARDERAGKGTHAPRARLAGPGAHGGPRRLRSPRLRSWRPPRRAPAQQGHAHTGRAPGQPRRKACSCWRRDRGSLPPPRGSQPPDRSSGRGNGEILSYILFFSKLMNVYGF